MMPKGKRAVRGNAITWEDFSSTATQSVQGNQCWLTWMGYANVLFLHFGETFIEPTEPSPGGCFHPPFYPVQVMVDFAAWELRQGDLVIASRLRASEEAIKVIEGLTVVDVVVSQHGASWITFEQDYRIVITPWSNEEFAANDAWSVRTADGYYSKLTCSGFVYKIHGDTPIYGDIEV